MKNIFLSYPQSREHLVRFLYPQSRDYLVRFFIELLSEKPTYGCERNVKDKEIYRNVFPLKIQFNKKNINVISFESY